MIASCLVAKSSHAVLHNPGYSVSSSPPKVRQMSQSLLDSAFRPCLRSASTRQLIRPFVVAYVFFYFSDSTFVFDLNNPNSSISTSAGDPSNLVAPRVIVVG